MPPFSLKNATRAQISIRSSIPIRFCTAVTPATYRLDAFRKNYMKGGLIGIYVYLSFQKPFRESPSSGSSHSRSRGKLYDTARPSACGKVTLLRMIAGLDVHGEVKQMGAHTCLLPGRSDVKAKNPQLTDIPQIASLQKWENGSHKDPPLRWRCCSPLCSLPYAFFSGWCRMPSRPIKTTHS